MTGTQVMALIIIGIVVTGICVGSAIGAWKQVQLAKCGYREGREGNLHKL